MAKSNGDRRATTISISLTPELARAVTERVQAGLYGSASELFREALRRLLEHELARGRVTLESPESQRLEVALGLQEFGLSVRAQRQRGEDGCVTDADHRMRLRRLADEEDAAVGLRVAPERLARLRLHEPQG